MRDTVSIYRGVNGQWFWRRTNARNGHVVAVGGEGYRRRIDCQRQARKVNRRARFEVES